MGETETSTKATARAKVGRVAAGSGAVLSLGASLVATGSPAGAATFNVTTTADSGAGSLRQAIQDANSNPGADTITFQAGLGTIGLTGGHLVVSSDVTITDPEADVTVDAGGTSRIFYINGASGSVTISGLTLTGGTTNVQGGAVISEAANLTIVDSTITGNSADLNGGGVYALNADTVTITDTTFTGNTSGSYGGGLRVNDTDSLVVTGSTFTGNSAARDGGGLDADAVASVVVTDTSFTDNEAGSDGGGLSIYGYDVTSSVTVTGVTASGNAADDQGGGMVIQSMAAGTATITGSSFTDNDGTFGGGATIARFVDEVPVTVDVTIEGSTFDANSTSEAGGGLYLADLPDSTITVSTSTFDGNEAGAGGGIAADNAGTVTIDSSTVSGNTAAFGGGIASQDTVLTVVSSTVSGNTAVRGGGGGIALYGVRYADVAIEHSTITGNTATFGGGVFLGGYGTATLDHNIIDGNEAIGQPVPAAGEPTFDDDGSAIFVARPRIVDTGLDTSALESVTLTDNLVNGTIAGEVVDAGGNIFNEPANLGPLADNGGPTRTHDLLAGSAALDAGDAAFAAPPSTDQRGLPRVSNGRIDIGAVEVQVQEPVTTTTTPPAGPTPVPANPTFTG